MNKRQMNKKANLTLAFVFIASSVVLIILAGLFTPMLVQFSTFTLTMGDNLIVDTKPTLENINNTAIRNQINASLQGAEQASADNISILAGFYQYAWVILIIVTGLIIFLLTRVLVETGGRGGLV